MRLCARFPNPRASYALVGHLSDKKESGVDPEFLLDCDGADGVTRLRFADVLPARSGHPIFADKLTTWGFESREGDSTDQAPAITPTPPRRGEGLTPS